MAGAIVVKFLGQTNHSPYRFKAKWQSGDKIETVTKGSSEAREHAKDPLYPEDYPAYLLAHKMELYGQWVRSTLPDNSRVYIRIDSGIHPINGPIEGYAFTVVKGGTY